MTSIGSNVGSSSGAGSSGGPTACAWLSLTLEEQLANFKRIICKWNPYIDAPFLKYAARVLKELRIDPCVNIESLLPGIPNDQGILLGSNPLHWAVLVDDRIMAQYILESGKVDVNAPIGHRGDTALFYALIGGNCDMVGDLLEHKADVCICNGSEESPLYYMVQQKDSMFGILKMVIANNVNMCDDQKNTILHHAARQGAINIVTYLIDQKADVNLHNHDGYTPLHYAAKKGFVDVVTYLLDHNVDVNALDNKRWSPLHYAVSVGAMNIVKLLVNHNADVHALNKDRKSPLFFSIEYQGGGTRNGLVAIGDHVHVEDEKANNALHLVIMAHAGGRNMLDIVKLLRQRDDVDANAKNSKGYSPFFAAVVDGHIEVVKELLKSKEKIKLMEECNGQTAIQIAFDYGHEHIKIALLECEDVSRYINDLYRDRQVYVDAANAILVGAALIASVTFASWLQPPLGYTTPYFDLAPSSSDVNYADVQYNVPLRAFWVFNALSFYFAIATVVFGARSVLPNRRMFIKAIVVKLHRNLLVTSILLAFSVFFVIIAFGIAGCIVLTPTLKFQWYMIVPTVFGGLVCLVSLGFLFKSMVEDNLEKRKGKEKETLHLYN